VSPILANLYLHHGLDRWFEGVVKPHCRGKALLIRYADDFVCAFQYREDAEAFYRVLPKRLAKFGLEVAPEKTRLLRFSRFHPGMRRRFAFLGFEFYWERGPPRRAAFDEAHGPQEAWPAIQVQVIVNVPCACRHESLV
jgi:RNA-directed DNA polymerase